MNTSINYWFTIEPYVYINIVDKHALLYNTIDGELIESDKIDVITLLQELLKEKNCGVVLLENNLYQQTDIKDFISNIREKYMGDIIDISLTNGKPIQVLPYFNYPTKRDKKCDFLLVENLFQTLSEITIHVDPTINIEKIINILYSIPENITFNIKGDWEYITNIHKLFLLLNHRYSSKNIECSYTHITVLDQNLKNNFSYKVSINFPIDKQLWYKSLQLLQNQDLLYEYIFNVTSLSDCQKAEELVEEYQIQSYHLFPVYTGNNIEFFKKYVFMTQEDIFSTPISLKDIFSKLSMNMHDFGKFNIMSNGDVYANVKHPVLGNIYIHSIYELIQKEIKEGKSWLRTRNQTPCCDCIYQYLCPSPSDYEIVIGKPNLCYIQ
jgi:hypothetical protein